MELLGWLVAGAACVALAGLWLHGRRATQGTGTAAVATAREEQATDVAFSRLPLAAMRVDSDGLIAATARARREFPFLKPGVSLLQSFGEADLARRVGIALETGEPDTFEARLFADGRRTYQVSVEPYAVEGGSEALVSLLDMTEAIGYQELRLQFVANVSHELRTPLTGIGGMLEALQDAELDTDLRLRFAGRAHREVLRLGALVEDILMLSELESGRDGVPAESSDLSSSVAAAVESLAEAADDAGVLIDVDLVEGAHVPLSAPMSNQLVANLVGNAIRYAGPGSQTRVNVEIVEQWVMLKVRDDGAGIPEQDLPHIFERFYRADPARSKAAGGTGLGLSIVKHMIEGHGGEVEAESREGFGTTIRVRLPLTVPAEAEKNRVTASDG